MSRKTWIIIAVVAAVIIITVIIIVVVNKKKKKRTSGPAQPLDVSVNDNQEPDPDIEENEVIELVPENKPEE